MKILVLKRDKVGDMLLTTPMLRVLRAGLPGARIEVVASDYNAWVLEGNRDVDRVRVYRRTRIGNRISAAGAMQQVALFARLRFEGFDVAIAAGGEASPRATRRARLVGAKRTIAFVPAAEARAPDALAEPTRGHERDRVIAMLAPLGVAAPSSPPLPAYAPPAAVLGGARAWLGENGLETGRFAVIGLGARRAKRQPDAQQVLRWAAWLRKAQGLDTIFMWTPGPSDNPQYPGDDAIAAPVLAAKPAWLHAFRGALLPAIGIVWHARISIFPDSGLMHFAAASPGGVLGLFAEREASPPPERWGPLGDNAAILEAPVRIADVDDPQFAAAMRSLLRAR